MYVLYFYTTYLYCFSTFCNYYYNNKFYYMDFYFHNTNTPIKESNWFEIGPFTFFYDCSYVIFKYFYLNIILTALIMSLITFSHYKMMIMTEKSKKYYFFFILKIFLLLFFYILPTLFPNTFHLTGLVIPIKIIWNENFLFMVENYGNTMTDLNIENYLLNKETTLKDLFYEHPFFLFFSFCLIIIYISLKK